MKVRPITIRFPEGLAARAKSAARGFGISFNALTVTGLLHELERLERQERARRKDRLLDALLLDHEDRS